MLRGEFVRGDGLIIPNNITTYGATQILGAALRGVVPNFHIGLANCNPHPLLNLNQLNEPTIGVNGYARQTIGRDAIDWLTQGDLSGEVYFETRNYVFVPTGGGFDKPITRPVIVNHPTDVAGVTVVAVGAALAEAITLLADTDEALRTFKYRIFAR